MSGGIEVRVVGGGVVRVSFGVCGGGKCVDIINSVSLVRIE